MSRDIFYMIPRTFVTNTGKNPPLHIFSKKNLEVIKIVRIFATVTCLIPNSKSYGKKR